MNPVVDMAVLLANYHKARHPARLTSRARLEEHQERAMARFRKQTLSRSPFYSDLAAAPLTSLPIMSKALMRANFDRINTRGITTGEAFAIAEEAERSRDFTPMIGDVSVGLSTGTSGQRGLFLASRRERMRWAGMILGRMLRGGLLGTHRIAFLLRANNPLYESVAGRGRIAFRFFDLKQPLADIHTDLVAFSPTILIAPAQVLRVLAEREAATASLLQPRQVISVAETLFDDDRALIEQVFKTRVEEIYQATEGFLAYSCPHGSLHLNELFVHIEPSWIDQSAGLFSPIVTDFSRETQPVVRYLLDDVLRLDRTACRCGTHERTLVRIEGRADDALKFPGVNRADPISILPDFVARAIAGAGSGPNGEGVVEDFRVTQKTDGTLSVRLKSRDFERASVDASAALRDLLHDHHAHMPAVDFEPMAQGDFLQKRRRIHSERSRSCPAS